jgi:hypothetical protein
MSLKRMPFCGKSGTSRMRLLRSIIVSSDSACVGRWSAEMDGAPMRSLFLAAMV